MLWANKTRGTDGGPRSVVRPNQDFGPISRRNAVVLDERDDRGRGALDACPRARAHGSVFGRGRYAIRIFDDILSAGASSAARSTMMISMDSAIVCAQGVQHALRAFSARPDDYDRRQEGNVVIYRSFSLARKSRCRH